MTRANVYKDGKLAGWFDPTEVKEEWDLKSYSTNDNRGTRLILTAGERWVLNHWTNWQGEAGSYELLSPDEAYEWLLSNEYHGAAEEHFEKKLPPEFWHDSSEPVVSES